jgi:protein required for attachment to host cells
MGIAIVPFMDGGAIACGTENLISRTECGRHAVADRCVAKSIERTESLPCRRRQAFSMEIFMQTTWIVAADSSRARIFEVDVDKHLREVEDFVNPAGRQQTREIDTDARGRFFGKGSAQGHTTEPDSDAPTHETELFSKQLSEFLDKACSEHRYDKLCLIAYPKLLGMMRDNLSKETKQRVKDEIPKDISWFDTKEIEDYVLHQHKLH